jgi:hypothetical protein
MLALIFIDIAILPTDSGLDRPDHAHDFDMTEGRLECGLQRCCTFLNCCRPAAAIKLAVQQPRLDNAPGRAQKITT